MQPKSILISFNHFKGSLENLEACEIAANVFKKAKIKSQIFPVADGGRGTLDAMKNAYEGEVAKIRVSGPLKGQVLARVLCLPDKTKPHTIVIESAEAIGYHLVKPEERDALRVSSTGLGELLLASVNRWKESLKKIYIGLGDSIVSDAGMGMLTGLGFIFRDNAGKSIWPNANGLRSIHRIEPPKVLPIPQSVSIIVLCDVLNPLCGPKGSARVFAPQKGATDGQVKLIELGMENFANRVEEQFGLRLHKEAMTGSAGGVAMALKAFFQATLVHGAPYLFDLLHWDRVLDQHELVLTGEGKTDLQTLSGKAPYEILQRAERAGKQVVIVSGTLGKGIEELKSHAALSSIQACGNEPNAKTALEKAITQIIEKF